MAPYSNRIGYRHFRWHGRDHTTAPNFEKATRIRCTAPCGRRLARGQRQRHAGRVGRHAPGHEHWPFNFDATQRFELTDSELTVRLAVTNIDARTQPVGLGWHPYFPKRTRSRLHIECQPALGLATDDQLPTRREPQASIDGEVRHLDFDNCFEGWPGVARLRDEKLALKLTSSLPYLVVFTPPTRDYYCVEPVSHVSNAIQMADPAAHGLVALAAGDTLDAWMTIEVATA